MPKQPEAVTKVGKLITKGLPRRIHENDTPGTVHAAVYSSVKRCLVLIFKEDSKLAVAAIGNITPENAAIYICNHVELRRLLPPSNELSRMFASEHQVTITDLDGTDKASRARVHVDTNLSLANI